MKLKTHTQFKSKIKSNNKGHTPKRGLTIISRIREMDMERGQVEPMTEREEDEDSSDSLEV